MSLFLDEFIEDIRTNIPGYIAVTVTEVNSGICYISDSSRPDFDPEVASVYNLEVAITKRQAIKALNLNAKIQDILITLNDQIHIIDLSEDGEYFIYLAVDSQQANLGMIRGLLRKYKNSLFNSSGMVMQTAAVFA